MSTRRATRSSKSAERVDTSAGRASRDSSITVRAIEQALEQLGIYAKLSDIVARAQSIESEVIQSRSRRKPGYQC